jgi:hypothetical protein
LVPFLPFLAFLVESRKTVDTIQRRCVAQIPPAEVTKARELITAKSLA